MKKIPSILFSPNKQSNPTYSKLSIRRTALCVQMDFTRTFEANANCNNINHVWSHVYKILVVLKYHRCTWANIFDTDICRSISIPKAFMHLEMSVSSNMIYIVALDGGFKCPSKIHLNTQCPCLFTMSWWFQKVGQLLKCKLMIFIGGPHFWWLWMTI